MHFLHTSVPLGPGHTTAKTTMTVTVTFTAMAKKRGESITHKTFFLHNGAQFVANFLLIVFFRPVELLRDVRV